MTGRRVAPSPEQIAAAWSKAARLVEAGNPAEAEADLRRSLARLGDDPELQHLLGVTLLRQARPAEAHDVLAQAAARLVPRTDVLMNLGNALLDLGRAAEALKPLSEAVRLSPGAWQPAYFLGLAAERTGDHARAADAFRRVIRLDAAIGDAHLRLMTALRLGERFAEAAAAARAALVLQPDDAPIRHDLAMLLALSGDPAAALFEVDEVLRRSPGFPEALNTRGNVLGDLKRPGDAVASYRSALAVAPNLADAHYNLANLDSRIEAHAVACRRYRSALALAPEHFNARNNMAAALMSWGRIDDAISAYDACLKQVPGWPDAMFNRGMALLLKGDMAGGLEGYEQRWRVRTFPGVRRNFPQPLWDGASFVGRRLLLHAEQGAGDTIQFARYVPLICERGGEVLLESPGSLARLLSTLEGGARIIRPGETIPPFDLHLPLGSAMRALGTEVASIPAKVPYLWADPADRMRWQQRLGGSGLKVGVTWQGNPDQGSEPHRSIPLQLLRPVLETPGFRFFALQKEFGREQMAELPPGLLTDVGPALTDFAETAAAIAELDLVITTCTSVAHLAGALGKPTWVLLRAAPDWRWLLGREDSPWYPSARLWRQPSSGDWVSVVVRVGQALRHFSPA